MRENSELCEEFHPIHLSKQVYSSICLPGENLWARSVPNAVWWNSKDSPYLWPSKRLIAVLRSDLRPPRSPLCVRHLQALTPPVSKGVFVMIPCQRNQSLSILKFRFLFHGFQGRASQAKTTIPALFLFSPSCPHLSSHLRPYWLSVRGAPAVFFPCGGPTDCCRQVPEDVAELNNAN